MTIDTAGRAPGSGRLVSCDFFHKAYALSDSQRPGVIRIEVDLASMPHLVSQRVCAGYALLSHLTGPCFVGCTVMQTTPDALAVELSTTDCTTLAAYMRQRHIMGERVADADALLIACYIATALATLASGMISVDGTQICLACMSLNPQSIYVRGNMTAALGDISAVLVRGTRIPNTHFFGARYLAPEVVPGAVANPSAGMWSLGCILYELCTGAPPQPVKPLSTTKELSTNAVINQYADLVRAAQARGSISKNIAKLLESIFVPAPARLTAHGFMEHEALSTVHERGLARSLLTKPIPIEGVDILKCTYVPVDTELLCLQHKPISLAIQPPLVYSSQSAPPSIPSKPQIKLSVPCASAVPSVPASPGKKTRGSSKRAKSHESLAMAQPGTK